MKHICKYYYIDTNGIPLFTMVALPEENGRFPAVIYRSPYVDEYEDMSEDDICARLLESRKTWLDAGYAVVYQHCRGRGKSGGDCIPYINEREDGLFLQEWVRNAPFYNGEIYLAGRSYTSSVHFVTAPFAPDIKGAVLEVQDSERYNCNYRNGFYKIGLHGDWYRKMYKHKSLKNINYTLDSFKILPLSEFSLNVFGERAEDFDEILRHPKKEDPFWITTRVGGAEAHDATKNVGIPILFVTGFYDIYTGGVFDMWNALDDSTKARSALIVHAYGHSGSDTSFAIKFKDGSADEKFPYYAIRWCDYIRGKAESPVSLGKVTYYKMFGDAWCTDDFDTPQNSESFVLGDGERTYRYDPQDPAIFKGGLSANFGNTAYQDAPNSREDIISVYTPVFTSDRYIKGKMKATLKVSSSAEDTCFYVRVSIAKEEGDYGLRDDINQISNFAPDYAPGDAVEMEFNFDEHAFVVHAGERLRVDISSSAFLLYVPHTNNKGLFSIQTEAKIAENTVLLSESFLTVYFE